MIVEDQAETIAFLKAAVGIHDAVRADESFETHVSFVFLAGDLAYKLKRTVRYDYLDFSTAEKRAAAAAAELALNRRTASSLYLEVRDIRRQSSGRLGFGGDGPLVDSVIVMRRFDQDCLLDRMARRGALTPGLMRDLADRIIAFHDSAEVDRCFGGHAGLAAFIDGNEANLALAVPAIFDAGTVEQLTGATRAALGEVRELVEARRLADKVRLCHGDLHLRNIVLLDGAPTLFDCIEFSRSIACVDVLYDLSFLLMDLAHRGLGDLASTVFNRYFDLSGEVEGAGALPLFLSMHAAIRAHVSAAAVLAGKPDDKCAGAVAEARAYAVLAEALLRSEKPRLIAIGGLSGTGKSTLACGLAPRIAGTPGARVLRSDVLRKRRAGARPVTPLPPEAYGEAAAHAVYARLGDEAGRLLRSGRSVIFDAVLLRAEERAAMRALAADLEVDFQGFWLEAPAEILAARLEARRGDASDATVEVLHRQLAMSAGPVDWVRLDAAGDTAAVLAAIIK